METKISSDVSNPIINIKIKFDISANDTMF